MQHIYSDQEIEQSIIEACRILEQRFPGLLEKETKLASDASYLSSAEGKWRTEVDAYLSSMLPCEDDAEEGTAVGNDHLPIEVGIAFGVLANGHVLTDPPPLIFFRQPEPPNLRERTLQPILNVQPLPPPPKEILEGGFVSMATTVTFKAEKEDSPIGH